MRVKVDYDTNMYSTKITNMDTGEDIRCRRIEIVLDASTGEDICEMTIIPDEIVLDMKKVVPEEMNVKVKDSPNSVWPEDSRGVAL